MATGDIRENSEAEAGLGHSVVPKGPCGRGSWGWELELREPELRERTGPAGRRYACFVVRNLEEPRPGITVPLHLGPLLLNLDSVLSEYFVPFIYFNCRGLIPSY